MENHRLLQSLIRYNRTFKDTDKIYHNFAKNYGLSYCAFWILYLMRETDIQYTQTELCSMLCMPKQTVNSAIKNLTQNGYINFASTENNKKNKILLLTENGKKFAHNSIDLVLQSEINALKQFSESELELFLSLNEKYSILLRREAENFDL